MKWIQGGVCAAIGFTAAGIHCGIRKNHNKRDLSLIVSEKKASAAAVYTRNLVKGAPIAVTKRHIADGYASAVICNSGNANTCNADGEEVAEKMSLLVQQATGIAANDVVVASTRVIGQKLDVTPIAEHMQALAALLNKDGYHDAAEGIMTTDTVEKQAALEFTLGGKLCHIGGMAKGSGMIHPNMATMLVFVTSDAAITPQMLQKALSAQVDDTFNMISVDGDTSTNDMVSVLANGMAENPMIEEEGTDFECFSLALRKLLETLCKKIAADGEGASKLLECVVTGALDIANAKTVAKSVVCSSLFKAAMFGADANWGRVLCAIGYSGAQVDVDKIAVRFASAKGEILVCENGAGVDFSEEYAKQILLEKEIRILITLGDGQAEATAWGCDLTYDYVKINGDYRT